MFTVCRHPGVPGEDVDVDCVEEKVLWDDVSRRECLRADTDYCVVGDWGLVRTAIMAEIDLNRVRVASTHDARIKERERPRDIAVRQREKAYDEEERHEGIMITRIKLKEAGAVCFKWKGMKVTSRSDGRVQSDLSIGRYALARSRREGKWVEWSPDAGRSPRAPGRAEGCKSEWRV